VTNLSKSKWLHRFAVLTALATLGLVGMGGLVTSHGVGMSVPDWPTSYGYNMFALPVSMWLTGGVFHEHTHRLWASIVGVLVVVLIRWLGGSSSRRPLMIVGIVELLIGLVMIRAGGDWRGGGFFLQGIGGVVLLAGIVWVRNDRAAGRLPAMGWAAFWLVQLQGLLGGLRVILDAQEIAGMKLGLAFGIIHGCLAQAFLVLLTLICLFTSRWWRERASASASHRVGPARLIFATTILIFLQLVIGASMRHQHAGLAIPDFPLAYGKVWPDMSTEAVATYNARRVEVTASNAITAGQIYLQLAHRAMAVVILLGVMLCARQWRSRLGIFWFGLVMVQATLGAWTIWSNKAADIATLHVVMGALSLVTGAVASVISFRRFYPVESASDIVETPKFHDPAFVKAADKP
jgi:cytochrome c oxidase assembly protein subunit 15